MPDDQIGIWSIGIVHLAGVNIFSKIAKAQCASTKMSLP
jgi:hypothetical protein